METYEEDFFIDFIHSIEHIMKLRETSKNCFSRIVIVIVKLLSRVRLFATTWTAAHQASLSFTISCRLLKLMSIESVMPSNHLDLCSPLHFLPLISPSIRVFSNESALCIRWPKYWSFSVNISPFPTITYRMDN